LGYLPASRSTAIRVSELSLAGAVMRERKQADHDPTGLLFGPSGQQRLERAGIGPAREQLIAR
jgi:hypothetical protein